MATEQKDFIVAIELGSSKVTGIAGQKKPDGSISVLAFVREESSAFIKKGVVYNIDKTAQCLTNIISKLEGQLKTRITQVFVGVGGQSIRSVRNTIGKDLPHNTVVTQEMVAELMDSNRSMEYPDQEILDVAEQEYRVDTQYQMDPVGIPAKRLEGNYLNILERKLFYKNLNRCFESANINVADMYLAPLALADAVLTETEKRSGCALVDIGADTTTVCVFWKNVLRHLVVIPLGSNNITKDIASLQMEESDAEAMKLKYASAFTDNNDIDSTLKYSIDAERQVESHRFIEIVEGRMEEIIENVKYQIPDEYYGNLLGGVILTGGGANMKNIERAFANSLRMEKVRVAKFVITSINSSNEQIKSKNAMYNTVLGMLIKGDLNCAGGPIKDGSLFDEEEGKAPVGSGRKPRQPGETDKGVILTEQEKERAAELARQQKEEEERRQREEEERKAAEELRKKKENSRWNRFKRGFGHWVDDLTKPE